MNSVKSRTFGFNAPDLKLVSIFSKIKELFLTILIIIATVLLNDTNVIKTVADIEIVYIFS